MSDFEIPPRSTRQVKKPTVLMEDIPKLAENAENTGDSKETENDSTKKKEEPKYSKEELLRVFDEIIFSGE